MSPERRSQWVRRQSRLQTLREKFDRIGHHDRAHRAYRNLQKLYDRWADEVFASGSPSR
jgi:hypothetical protein